MANNTLLEGFKSLFKVNEGREVSKTLFEQLDEIRDEDIEESHPQNCTCKDCKEEKKMDEFLDADIDVALDASGQSVGIAGGTGSTGGFNSTNNPLNPLKKEEDLGLGAGIALAGAGIGAGMVGSKLFDGYDRKETIEKLHEILDRVDEASMSPEDEHDSALIKSALDKIEKRSNARFTPEEQAVLDKYGIERDIEHKNLRAGDRFLRSDADKRNMYRYDTGYRVSDGDVDKINYADRARKMPTRDANQAIRDNRITNSHMRGGNLLKDERQRAANDMRADYQRVKGDVIGKNWEQGFIDRAEDEYSRRMQKAKYDYDQAIKSADDSFRFNTVDRAKRRDRYQSDIDSVLADRRARRDARLATKNEAYSVKEIYWIDDGGLLGAPGEKLYKRDIIDYWKEYKNKDSELIRYDGDFMAWLHDLLPQMTRCENYYEDRLVKQEACGRKSNKKKSIKEGTNPRENTDRLFELIDNGIVDAYDVAMCLADWMSNDEVGECMYTNEIFYDDEDVEESLNEDTIKTSKGKWVNKGDTGETHGEFKTKKEADAQRRAMYAQGFKK